MTRQLQSYSPFSDLWDLQGEVNKIFRNFGMGVRGGETENRDLALWAPAVDIMEDQESVKLTVELPGLKQNEVKVNVENGVLTLKGERKMNTEQKRDNYYRIERTYGAFSRSFSLPPTVDTEKICASMTDGRLEILIPKKETAKPKEITIAVK